MMDKNKMSCHLFNVIITVKPYHKLEKGNRNRRQAKVVPSKYTVGSVHVLVPFDF